MKLDIEAIKRQEPKALKELLAVVKKSAWVGCSKVMAEDRHEDIAQDVFMLFITNLVYRFDEAYQAEPFLIETCKRVAMSQMRRKRELLLEDLYSLPGEMEDAISKSDRVSFTMDDSPVSFIDQKKYMQKILAHLPGTVDQHRNLPEVEPKNLINKGRKPSKKSLSPSCLRIREIRLSLSMTQESFSKNLGIPNTTLLSYEYGRTPTVKEDTLRKAEEMLKFGQNIIAQNELWANRSMKEVIEEWCKTLGIEKNNVEWLAAALGVDKSTIYRWLNEEMRPTPDALRNYSMIIENNAKQIKKSIGSIQKVIDRKLRRKD